MRPSPVDKLRLANIDIARGITSPSSCRPLLAPLATVIFNYENLLGNKRGDAGEKEPVPVHETRIRERTSEREVGEKGEEAGGGIPRIYVAFTATQLGTRSWIAIKRPSIMKACMKTCNPSSVTSTKFPSLLPDLSAPLCGCFAKLSARSLLRLLPSGCTTLIHLRFADTALSACTVSLGNFLDFEGLRFSTNQERIDRLIGILLRKGHYRVFQVSVGSE